MHQRGGGKFLVVIFEHCALQKLVSQVHVSPKMQFIHHPASGWLQITMVRIQNNLLPSVTEHNRQLKTPDYHI